ncbi:hypothetical protein BC834DRAFT_684220 [Gloeopeniophorella convolvens]|nr:hypothetical protein BC834DRAFT_684220 [Gloeopeniophorella convolvens]
MAGLTVLIAGRPAFDSYGVRCVMVATVSALRGHGEVAIHTGCEDELKDRHERLKVRVLYGLQMFGSLMRDPGETRPYWAPIGAMETGAREGHRRIWRQGTATALHRSRSSSGHQRFSPDRAATSSPTVPSRHRCVVLTLTDVNPARSYLICTLGLRALAPGSVPRMIT